MILMKKKNVYCCFRFILWNFKQNNILRLLCKNNLSTYFNENIVKIGEIVP